MCVEIADIDYTATYEVTVEYSILPELPKARREVLMKLLTSEGSFTNRMNLYNKIKTASSVDALFGVIKNSDLSAIEKIRLTETFN